MLIEIPGILSWADVQEIRRALGDAAFVDGAETAGFRAVKVKQNEQAASGEGKERAQKKIVAALRDNGAFQRAAFPRTIRTPLISRYRAGMAYGRHVDDALMGAGPMVRSDLSVTVFLSDPGSYEGGELVIDSGYGTIATKLPMGAAVLYPSDMLHEVSPVTSGERLAAVTWVQSHVRDAAARTVLHDLDRIRRLLAASQPDAAETDLAFKTYANLLRRWCD